MTGLQVPPLQIGESFVGSGVNAAHINTVLGERSGPAGAAWATALATPSAGHVPFMVVVKPGVPVQPPTLFVTKAAPDGDTHGTMIWGPAQAGVAHGVLDALEAGAIDSGRLSDLVLITAVWVNPGADDADEVYRNNREATRTALSNGRDGLPGASTVLAAADDLHNPFYNPPKE